MNDLQTLIPSLTALIVALTGLAAILAKLWHRDNITDNRVDLLWKFHLSRGEVEAKRKKLVTEIEQVHTVDTIELSPEVRAAYEPLAPFLSHLRRTFSTSTREQLAELIEKRYGVWLVKHICQVLRVSEGACLRMALAVAEEDLPKPSTEEVKRGPPEPATEKLQL